MVPAGAPSRGAESFCLGLRIGPAKAVEDRRARLLARGAWPAKRFAKGVVDGETKLGGAVGRGDPQGEIRPREAA